MSIVTLVSGGLDSTLMAQLTQEEGLTQHPLFINYGQRNAERELSACLANFKRHDLPTPQIADVRGFGALIPSGITSQHLRIVEDAFLPCRNLLFLTIASSYAHHLNATSVGIGLLSEEYSIFPDQTKEFLMHAESTISKSLNTNMKFVAPLMHFSKFEIVKIARAKGIDMTYSCHAGTEMPCGECIACREYIGTEA